MANFVKSYAKTIGIEGGYSNHSSDRGKETYRGISRRYHPNWEGWDIIDLIKERKDRNQWDKILSENGELQGMVMSFYKDEFWDRINGDSIQNQEIADELFDTAVNMGVYHSIIFLQRSLNCLNKKEKLWPNIKVDGKSGQKTMEALDRVLLRSEVKVLAKMLNVQQGCRYMDLMENDEDQEDFARGWFVRVSLP